jgi:hypothetical protein
VSIPTELSRKDLGSPRVPGDPTHTDPHVSDHGAWDAPTVADAPEDAVKGGLTTVARGIGAGLGVGTTVISRATTALVRRVRPLR